MHGAWTSNEEEKDLIWNLMPDALISYSTAADICTKLKLMERIDLITSSLS